MNRSSTIGPTGARTLQLQQRALGPGAALPQRRRGSQATYACCRGSKRIGFSNRGANLVVLGVVVANRSGDHLIEKKPRLILLAHRAHQTLFALRQICCHYRPVGGVGCGLFLLPENPYGGPSGFAPPLFSFGGPTVFTPLECRLRAADCQRMVAHAPNPRFQATLADMARTWTRLALEAEQTLRESRPALQLIETNPLPPHASQRAPRGS